MYNVNKNTDSEGINRKNYLGPGIHEDVEFTGIEFHTSPNGNDYMLFTFTKGNSIFNHTEYESRDNDPEKLISKKANQIKRVKHIVTKFISEEVYDVTATSYKEFYEKTVTLLKDNYKNVKVRIKIVLNNNNYTTLPNYTPFIERMDVPKDKTKLDIYTIDKMQKDLADSETPTVENPFVAKNNQPDELPF
jgi:hypothetical protein